MSTQNELTADEWNKIVNAATRVPFDGGAEAIRGLEQENTNQPEPDRQKSLLASFREAMERRDALVAECKQLGAEKNMLLSERTGDKALIGALYEHCDALRIERYAALKKAEDLQHLIAKSEWVAMTTAAAIDRARSATTKSSGSK